MKTVTVLELKAKAGELVRSVRRTGEEIQITDNDEVVALLVPSVGAVKEKGGSATLDKNATEILDEEKIRDDFKESLKVARATAKKYNITRTDIDAEIRAVRRGK